MNSINKLRKEFDQGVVALDSIDLELRDTEFVALLGPSGCGKSTTLNCIAGLLDVTSGQVMFDDADVTTKAPKDRNIGMVFQAFALYPHLKVIDNIAFPLKQKGVSKEERHKKAREMAVKLQIEQLLDRKPTQRSGGQQQRVAIGRALITRPALILADEPTGNLDTQNSSEVIALLKEASKKYEQTIIMITHNRSIAQTADRVLQVSDGVLTDFGRCCQ